MKRFYFFALILTPIFSNITLDVPYGRFEIDNPCIEELLQSPPFERLKKVHQYGISTLNQIDYTYSRYDHCLGVFLILNHHQLSQKEQISGLLHDVSHTAFSHFGDYFFKSHGEDAWQDLNHNQYLQKTGLASILEKNHFLISDVYHKNKEFQALDQSLPHLCADRLDYNIQGAFRAGLLTKQELQNLFHNLKWENNSWSLSDVDLAKKLSFSCIYMMETIWSCPVAYLSNLILSKIADIAISIQLFTADDIWLKSDTDILNTLQSCNNHQIQEGLELIEHLPSLVEEGSKFNIKYKCRAIDPMIRKIDRLEKLSDIDPDFKNAFENAKKRANRGFFFSIDEQILEDYKIYFEELLK